MAGYKKIKVDLVYLDKTQVDLIRELPERGFSMTRATMSRYLSGNRIPHDPRIMDTIFDIMKKWKNESTPKQISV